MKLFPGKDEKPSRTRQVIVTIVALALIVAWSWYRTEYSDGAAVAAEDETSAQLMCHPADPCMAEVYRTRYRNNRMGHSHQVRSPHLTRLLVEAKRRNMARTAIAQGRSVASALQDFCMTCWVESTYDSMKCVGVRIVNGRCGASSRDEMTDAQLRDYYKNISKVTLTCGSSVWVGWKIGGVDPRGKLVTAGYTGGLCLFHSFVDMW